MELSRRLLEVKKEPQIDLNPQVGNLAMSGDVKRSFTPVSIPSPSFTPPKESRCRICDRHYDGSQHFGIDICRACAAFFRRAAIVRKNYICRRGTNNCQLNTPRKVTCQKCRWTRCLQVGLKVEFVIVKESLKTSTPEKMDLEEDDDSGSDNKSLNENEEPPQIFRPIPLQMNINPNGGRSSFLHKLLYNYREFTRKRLEIEMSVPLMNDQKVMVNGRIMYKTTRNRLAEIYKHQMPLLHEFLSDSFEVYKNNPPEEQKRISALFYPVLWEIEACYWTYRYFNTEVTHEKVLLTQTTFIDSNDILFWMGDYQKNSEIEVAETKRLTDLMIQRLHQLVIAPMHSLIITEIELVILLALNVWAPRNHRINESADRKSSEMRSKIFDEVHNLYRNEMKMDNYSNRLGNLMCFFADIQTSDIQQIADQILFNDLQHIINGLKIS